MTITKEQEAALDVARALVEAGIPVFTAKPAMKNGKWDPAGGHNGCGYWLPGEWEQAQADPKVLDRWRPGQALCALMGHGLDLVDVDPRSDGDKSYADMLVEGVMPTAHFVATTPSDGEHYFVASMGVHSRDLLRPGLDVKAGVDGKGHGLAFIAPTLKRSKTTGEVGQYRWVTAPSKDALDMLQLIGDDSGERLAAEVRRHTPKAAKEGAAPTYTGPTYDELSPGQKLLADAEVEARVGKWRELLAHAAKQNDEDWRDTTTGNPRGWELLARDSAWAVAKLAAAPWSPLDEDSAADLYESILPDEFADDDKCNAKWGPGLVAKAAADGEVDVPGWLHFRDAQGGSTNPDDYPEVPQLLDDSNLAPWLAWKGLEGRWRYAVGLGWAEWDGRRWQVRREEHMVEALRVVMLDIYRKAPDSGADLAKIKSIAGLLSAGRIGSVMRMLRGHIAVDAEQFDRQPDMLNVGNGVVHLPTGQLLPHDPHLYLTKITETPWEPGARHADWDQCLTALDPEVAEWMQVRFGQGATGYPTEADILPVGQGGGSNGKSTLLAGLYSAMGDHVTVIPEKLLRASPNDHPTELMTLRGARIAVIDETPEVAQLSVPRLKAALGSPKMTARAIRQDNVSWMATHSLFVMTNYVPHVAETDKGTWRRLALVRFTKTFPVDGAFRARVVRGQGGRAEAVLAWVVEGARKFYANGRRIPDAPARVVADTRAWRMEADLVLRFLDDRMIFDPAYAVTASDLLNEFNDWLDEQGHRGWSERQFSGRFAGHEEVAAHRVEKGRATSTDNIAQLIYEITGRPWVWRGIRWRRKDDPR